MLIKKAVAVRKHLSINRKDRDGKLYVKVFPQNGYADSIAASFSSSPVSTVSPATTRPSAPSHRPGGTRAPPPPLSSHERSWSSSGSLIGSHGRHFGGVSRPWTWKWMR